MSETPPVSEPTAQPASAKVRVRKPKPKIDSVLSNLIWLQETRASRLDLDRR